MTQPFKSLRSLKSPIIDVRNLWFTYGNHVVLENVTFTLFPGEYVGLIGPNGGGKSTLVQILLGILKPTKGSVKVMGVGNSSYHCCVGYVPQNLPSNEVGFPATVLEVVLSGLAPHSRLFGMYTKSQKTYVRYIMETVGISDLSRRRIGELSGGQRQKVFIARALVARPQILVLDEPDAGVDGISQKAFYALVGALNKENKMTIILVSHDIDAVTREVSKVLCLNKTMMCHSTVKEFLSDTALSEFYGHDVKLVKHHPNRHA